jgi:hypothetical protein
MPAPLPEEPGVELLGELPGDALPGDVLPGDVLLGVLDGEAGDGLLGLFSPGVLGREVPAPEVSVPRAPPVVPIPP